MFYERNLNLAELLKAKSYFLFGPRGTGKTSLIAKQLENAKVYDLLDADIFRALIKRPKLLEDQNTSRDIIVIDEIQKFPALLDEVHRLISKKGYKFLLTGSSARKLKHGAANLLGGRAWQSSLFPLCSNEIPDFDFIKYLNTGGLPAHYLSNTPQEELQNYISLYLQEEIQEEALTRNIPAFAEFLELIALTNGKEISYDSLASDCGVSPSTIKNYLEILTDTLIGFHLTAFTKTKKRKAISRGKFYLFDVGVVNSLCQRGEIKLNSELFGSAFEQFILQEIRAYLGYTRKNIKMHYWRSTSQFEVDLILGNKWAVEIKSTKLVQEKHLKGLNALKEEKLIENYAVISQDSEPRKIGRDIHILPWDYFLKNLWGNKFLK